MKRSLFGLAALLILAPNAFAMGKSPFGGPSTPSGPPSSGFSKFPVVEGHASALQRSWKKAEEDWDKDYGTLSGSLKTYEASLASARKAEGDAAAALARSQSAYGEAQANLVSLNTRISDLDRAWMDKRISPEERDRQLREIESAKQQGIARVETLRAESESMKTQLGAAQSAVASVQGQIQSHLKKVYEQDVDVKALSEGDLRASVARLGETVLKDRKAAHVQRVTDELFDSIKDDYMKSDFLVSDLAKLKADYGFTGERLESVKRSMEKRLNDTLLGGYIQDQIKKAMARSCGDAKYQAACAAGNTQQLNEILDGFLRSGVANPAVSGAGVKPVQVAPGAGPSGERDPGAVRAAQ